MVYGVYISRYLPPSQYSFQALRKNELHIDHLAIGEIAAEEALGSHCAACGDNNPDFFPDPPTEEHLPPVDVAPPPHNNHPKRIHARSLPELSRNDNVFNPREFEYVAR
jgi:hypothetical protein